MQVKNRVDGVCLDGILRKVEVISEIEKNSFALQKMTLLPFLFFEKVLSLIFRIRICLSSHISQHCMRLIVEEEDSRPPEQAMTL